MPLLLPVIDTVLFVVAAGESRKGAVDAALNLIGEEKILGLFVNRSTESSQKKYYSYEYNNDDDATETTDGK